MRVGVVTTSYPREPGDPAGVWVAGLAQWLARQGHEVEVVAAGPGATEDGSVRITRVEAGARALFHGEGAPERLERDWTARAAAPLFSIALAARVAWAARRWDGVISHWLLPCGVIAAGATALARPGLRRPHVAIAHSGDVHLAARPGLRRPHVAIAHSGDVHLAARPGLRRPHVAIAHSGDVHLAARPGVADAVAAALVLSGARVAFAGEHLRARLCGAVRNARLRERLAEGSFVTPMGIGEEWFAAGAERGAAEQRAGGPVVLFMGRLVPVKGVDVLIDAVALLQHRTSSTSSAPSGAPPRLVVAGAGPERARLAARAAAAGIDAHFVGEVRGAARTALFAHADLLALPSVVLDGGRTEGTPVVALEALAAGLPLVASDVGGVRAACGADASLIPPRDPAALAAAIADALAHPAEARARAARGRLRARAWSWDTVGPRFAAALVTP